jgi:hypothetical protein
LAGTRAAVEAVVRSILVALSVLAAGCVGVISTTDGTEPAPSTNNTTSAACEAIVPPSPLRRLTREQYNNTIRDLLGVADAPANEFVEDDVISGFAVAGNVAPLLAEQHVAAAEKLAAKVDVSKIAPADKFVHVFLRRAFRRPPSADDEARYSALLATGATFTDGARLVIEAALLSPRFHYLPNDPPDHAVASRLSYFLWGTTPDDGLLELADKGALHTPEQVAEIAKKMVDDARARPAMASFYRQWLQIDKLDGMTRDAKEYAGWDFHSRASYRKSIETFTMEAKTLDELLTSPRMHADESLAKILNVPVGVSDADPSERAGLVTHPAIMAINAKSVGSDPIHRGIFVRTQLLCQDLPPPPPDVDLDIEQPKPGLSTRERFAAHTKNASCASCHKLIDGIGFGLESYDALGRFRTMDQGVPVDARGELVSTDVDGAFVGGAQLAKMLAGSGEVRRCFATKWTTFALARAITEADRCGIDGLSKAFADSKGDIKSLLVSIAELDAFRKVSP